MFWGIFFNDCFGTFPGVFLNHFRGVLNFPRVICELIQGCVVNFSWGIRKSFSFFKELFTGCLGNFFKGVFRTFPLRCFLMFSRSVRNFSRDVWELFFKGCFWNISRGVLELFKGCFGLSSKWS